MDRIFEYVKRQRSRSLIKVRCTYLEIYNERVYDLLNYEETRQLKSGLEVRQDRERGVYAPDATDVLVSTEDEVRCLCRWPWAAVAAAHRRAAPPRRLRSSTFSGAGRGTAPFRPRT